MKVAKTQLNGVLLIKLDPFEDHRGEYVEIYNKELYQKNGINVKFIQDDISVSNKNVLRGIHGDQKTWKLISCLHGEFFLVVVNNDENSDQYRNWITIILSDRAHKQVLVPPYFGNGHLVLSDKAVFHYKQSTYYNPKGQFTIKWDDPDLNIPWPVKNPILSNRDKKGHYAMEKIDCYDPINIGTGVPVTIRDVLQAILKAANYSDAIIEYNTSKPTMIPKRLIDVSKAKRFLGFEAKTNIYEGIKRTVDWYRKTCHA